MLLKFTDCRYIQNKSRWYLVTIKLTITGFVKLWEIIMPETIISYIVIIVNTLCPLAPDVFEWKWF